MIPYIYPEITFMKIIHNLETISFTTKTALTIGGFDGIHLGHSLLIQSLLALKQKDPKIHTVLLTFDPLPKNFFVPTAHNLLTPLDEKLELLQNFGLDYCYIIEFNTKIANMSAEEFYAHIIIPHIHPSQVIIGHNHTFGKNKSGDLTKLQGIAHSYNFELIPKNLLSLSTDPVLIISSGTIKNLLANGDILTANQMLGYTYQLNGKVIKGKQLGRTLGFPTANILVDSQKFLPKFGVYKVSVKIDTQTYQGLLNVGTNPTTDNDKTPKIEVFIKNFDQDIYGQHITVYLESFVREEKKFESIDALKKQMQLDLESY
jgi:riboflavin kinase/FMN adenylyltransferase